VWKVVYDRASGRWLLGSVTARYVWTAPGVHDRTLPRLVTEVPMAFRSGFHLFKNRLQALRLAFVLRHTAGCVIAFGEAEAFGRVVEHDLGYRAQRVAIRRLTVCRAPDGSVDLTPVVDSLARGYECEVDIFAEGDTLRERTTQRFTTRPHEHPQTEWNHLWPGRSDSVATDTAPDDGEF
jgi:hypothetical protein